MMGTATDAQLDPVLKAVSRSFFLTLKVAPRVLRPALGIGYLFCRAADTIADTRLLSPAARRDCLARYRAQFEAEDPDLTEVESIGREAGPPQAIPEERELLVRLGECFRFFLGLGAGDRDLLRRLVATLTRGMEMDLGYFPAEESGEVRAFETDAQLDEYIYFVAGCVGEFWTELQVAHVRELSGWDLRLMRAQGVRFGKGLQMTNILRDFDRDLELGRCYLPLPRLRAVGVTVGEVKRGSEEVRYRLRPVVRHYLDRTVEHYRAGWEYVRAIPTRLVRLRLACAWPLLIGLRTLERLAASDNPLREGTLHKIPRSEVYRLVGVSTCRALARRTLDRLYGALESRLMAAIERLPRLDPPPESGLQ